MLNASRKERRQGGGKNCEGVDTVENVIHLESDFQCSSGVMEYRILEAYGVSWRNAMMDNGRI